MPGHGTRASGRDAGPRDGDGSYGRPESDGRRIPGDRAASRAAGRSATRRGRKKPRGRRIGRILMGLGAFVVLVAAAGAAWLYHLNGNIKHGALDAGVAPQKGAVIPGAMNILMLGSDTRDTAQDTSLGGADNSLPHADVEMLVHLSADHKNATVLSIPRDTDVRMPDCVENGKRYPGKPHDQITNSMNYGPGCTVAAVNQLTGVHIDHYMVIDFSGVVSMSDAVGGVQVCVDNNVYDPASHLKLSQGSHTLSGVAALEFLRTRHGFGDGGDVKRTVAQHIFLSALIQKLKSASTLTNPSDVLGLATAASKALSVDDGLAGVTNLVSLANTLGQVPTNRITFATMPVIPDPINTTAWVAPGPGSAELFQAIANDQSLTTDSSTPGADPSATPSTAPSPTSAPADVIPAASIAIHVLNGTGVAGRASAVQSELAAHGYHDTVTGDTGKLAATKVQYSPSSPVNKQQAQQVATALGLPDTALDPTGTRSSVYLLVGPDLTVGAQPGAGATAAPVDISQATANAQTENAAATGKCAPVNTYPLGGLPADLGSWNGMSAERAYAKATAKGIPDSDKTK